MIRIKGSVTLMELDQPRLSPCSLRVSTPPCSVDCDGGGIGVALSKEDKSAIIRLDRVRIWQNNKPDEEAEDSLVAGADDRIFRLDRIDTRECASLVTDRKELAAIRHK
jgi:hypothetical protein